MPKTTDFANRVLALVAEDMDVAEDAIMSRCRHAEVVDARHTLIKLLHAKGVYPSRIACIFSMTTRAVNYVITAFDDRLSANRALRTSYERIAKQLGDNSETTEKQRL